jgi:hypothetical protein
MSEYSVPRLYIQCNDKCCSLRARPTSIRPGLLVGVRFASVLHSPNVAMYLETLDWRVDLATSCFDVCWVRGEELGLGLSRVTKVRRLGPLEWSTAHSTAPMAPLFALDSTRRPLTYSPCSGVQSSSTLHHPCPRRRSASASGAAI